MSQTHVATLEASIVAMNEALAELSRQLVQPDSSSDAAPATDLVSIVHRPGWTTIAEAMLVESIAVTITHHARALTQAHKSLIAGALAVGD
ncbi:hypothetical protein A5784_20770 [Mycobacterium sp. 852013-50091_SCH5140682]|uniref:hypothetical protein n=1 Tax=Mycobacterium sp. 852013-50091_SCH5140682 TaxID=1834109 RepID=UPI0007EBB616|nr:hypothetical protein [Mycobacterium sp. 852013-50091_SCH5140682]OBC00274.1 hypothetical protein A5784_20770 [Mycobacterium sp. 852013-50091_SCH5140682]